MSDLRTAARRPERRIWLGDRYGSTQVWADDGGGRPWRATAHPGGVSTARIDASGDMIWWFADTDGSEVGRWMTVPFDRSAPAEPARWAPVGRPRGVVLDDGFTAIATGVDSATLVTTRSSDEGGSATLRSFEFEGDGRLVASFGGTQLVIARQSMTRIGWSTEIRTPDGDLVVATDDDGRGVDPTGVGGDRVLVGIDRRGFVTPAWWDPETNAYEVIVHGLAGDVTATWSTADVVLWRTWRGRTDLHVVDGSTVRRVDLPAGTVQSWARRADGQIEAVWSSAAHPPQFLTAGSPPTPPETPAPAIEVLDIDGPGGPIRVQLTVAAEEMSSSTLWPAVFLVHGGPAYGDSDEWLPTRAAWAAAGYVVVQADYRGSTGYGVDWRLANHGHPGDAELEDLNVVRSQLIADGRIDGERVALVGRSWGGYLTLLGLGRTPGAWRCGVAIVPVGDPALSYPDMFEEIRGAYRQRFGGTPATAPETYRRASPITCVDAVEAPVMVIAGRADPRCPIGQIDAWVDAARVAGVEVDYLVADGGHADRTVSDRLATFDRQRQFVDRVTRPAPSAR